jgi:hypothetical protein
LKKDYIIFAPEYVSSNGVRVLYKLADEIKKRGYKAFIFSVPNPELNYDFITSITPQQQENSIVIYPEVIKGNPLKIKNVVRWILFFPAKIGGDYDFPEYENIFVFDRVYYPEGDILYIPNLDYSLFYEDKSIEKDVDCYFVYKGGKWREIKEFDSMIEINAKFPSKRKELADLLRRTRILYSYDKNSLLLDEALLCGCQVKLVTQDGFVDYKTNYDICSKGWEEKIDNFIEKTQKYDYKGKIPKRKWNYLKLKPMSGFIKNRLRYLFYKFIKKDIVKAQRYFINSEARLGLMSVKNRRK